MAPWKPGRESRPRGRVQFTIYNPTVRAARVRVLPGSLRGARCKGWESSSMSRRRIGAGGVSEA